VARFNPERQVQAFRFWTDTGRLQALPLIFSNLQPIHQLRSFPDGKQAVGIGTATGPGHEAGEYVYVINLESGSLRRLNPGRKDQIWSLAATRDGRNVLATTNAGDFSRVISFPSDGRSPARDLLALTSTIWNLDTGPGGTIYLDQIRRPADLVRFSPAGGRAQRIASIHNIHGSDALAVLPDGRAVVVQLVAGRSQLTVIEAGREPAPLANSTEETAGPVAAVGPDQAAFLIGPEPRRTIALAAVANGRITRRIPFDHGSISSLAATPDGKTIFCAADGTVWAIPLAGEPKKVRAGDQLAVDPDGRYLLVEVVESPVIRFVRVPLNGGPEQEIPRVGPLRAAYNITPNAFGKDGRILTPLGTSTMSWPPGIIDPSSGRYTRIPIDLDLDYHAMAWTPDGRIIAIGLGTQSALWKFQPETR
jgi:hypothetical protein